MKGLDLSMAYWWNIGRNSFFEIFPDIRYSVGLIGPGSECYGYDDELSRDHDWGPSFCIFVDERNEAARIDKWYRELPQSFMGYSKKYSLPGEENRVGGICCHDYFFRYTSLHAPPSSISEWQCIPESTLSLLSNGRVFETCGNTEFDSWRAVLDEYYPESLYMRKIEACLMNLAQSGQYNYFRSLQRQDEFTIQYTKSLFIDNSLDLLFLLNRRYAPYYKWKYRMSKELSFLGKELSYELSLLLNSEDGEASIEIINIISGILTEALVKNGITESNSIFFLDHVEELRRKLSEL